MIDLEAACSDILRADPDVAGRTGGRVWISMPANPSFPAILIRRVGGLGSGSYQGHMFTDAADIDLHCYGGSRVEALSLAHAAVGALHAAVTKLTVKPFSMVRFPDSDVPYGDDGRQRERYIASVRAWGH